jgi:protein arginine kinase activator
MLCDNCKERDSVVTLTTSDAQGVTELHLCERCAAERGIETQMTAPKQPLTDFILAVQKQLPATLLESSRCSFCSGTLRDFKNS